MNKFKYFCCKIQRVISKLAILAVVGTLMACGGGSSSKKNADNTQPVSPPSSPSVETSTVTLG